MRTSPQEQLAMQREDIHALREENKRLLEQLETVREERDLFYDRLQESREERDEAIRDRDVQIASAREVEEQYGTLRDAATAALDVLHDPAQTWLPAAEILSVALTTSSPATTSSGEVLGTETPEAAGSASPETSSPASEPDELIEPSDGLDMKGGRLA